MKFTLTIDSDNDSCQTRADIKYSLLKVASKLEESNGSRILDINGNAVGEWSIEIDDSYGCDDVEGHRQECIDAGRHTIGGNCTRCGH